MSVRSSTIDLFPLPPSPNPSLLGRPSSARSSIASGSSSTRAQPGPGPADAEEADEREARRRRKALARILRDKRAAAAAGGTRAADGSPGPGSTYFELYGPCSTSPTTPGIATPGRMTAFDDDGETAPTTTTVSANSGKFVQFPPAPAAAGPPTMVLPVRPPFAPAAASTQQWLADVAGGGREVLVESSAGSSVASSTRRGPSRLSSSLPLPPVAPLPLRPPPSNPISYGTPPFAFLSLPPPPPASPTPSTGASSMRTTPTRSSWGAATTANDDHTGSRSIEHAQIVAAEIRYRNLEDDGRTEGDVVGASPSGRTNLKRSGSAGSRLVFTPGRVVGAGAGTGTSSPVTIPPPVALAPTADVRRSSCGLGPYPFLNDPPPPPFPPLAPAPSSTDYPFASKLATASSDGTDADVKAGRRASSSPSVASSFRTSKAKRWVLSQLPPVPPALKRRSTLTSSHRASISTFSSTAAAGAAVDNSPIAWPAGVRRTPSRILKREAELSLRQLLRRAARVRTLLDDRGGSPLSTPSELRAPEAFFSGGGSAVGIDKGGYVHHQGQAALASRASGLRSWTSIGGGGTSSQRTPSSEVHGADGQSALAVLQARPAVSEEGSGEGRVKEEVDVVVIGFGQDQPLQVRPCPSTFAAPRAAADRQRFDPPQTRGVQYTAREEKDLPPLPRASGRLSRISSLHFSTRQLADGRRPRTLAVLVVALIAAIVLVGLLAG